jgi:hypothetical protein
LGGSIRDRGRRGRAGTGMLESALSLRAALGNVNIEKGTRMRQMRVMIVSMALVSVVGLIPWRAISSDQAAATPVVQDEQAQATPVVEDLQGQTTPGVEVFQLNPPTAEFTGECFGVTPPCGWSNCTSLGSNYSCFNLDTCCCPGKMCQ